MTERNTIMGNVALLQDWMFDEGANQLDDGHYAKGTALCFGAGVVDGIEIMVLSFGLVLIGLGVYCQIKK